MWTIEIIVIAVMIAFNSVFAAYEIALASISIGRLESLSRSATKGSAAALRMKQRMEASLAVVQLGITLVGATAAATGGAGAEESLAPVLVSVGIPAAAANFISIAIVVAILTVVTIVFGELVPKVFALRNKEAVCLGLSPIMFWFAFAVWPAVWFLESSVSVIMKLVGSSGSGSNEQSAMQELHGAAALARMSRMIGHREEGIIVSASRLASTPVKKIMLPAEYISMLETTQNLSTALITAHNEMHTRFPVTEESGNTDRIVGYVNFKDVVAALRVSPKNPTIRGLLRAIPSFRAEQSVSEALEQLIHDHNHIALVRDDRQHVIGMITMEDIVEELVGEIHDEFDRMPSHLNTTGQGWIAGGFVTLKRIEEETGIQLLQQSEKPIYTLSDWVVEELGRPPKGGDEITIAQCVVSVRKVRHTLVQEAFLRLNEDAEIPDKL